MKKFTIILFILLLTLILSVNFLFKGIVLESNKELTEKKFQFWAHRGMHSNPKEENSFQAFKKAIEFGAKGIEVDVQYLVDKDRFLIAHDMPTKEVHKELYLDDLFKELKDKCNYWIDFKNLNKTNYIKSSARLLEISKKYNNQKNVFVESKKIDLLEVFKKAGFKTIFWVKFSKKFPYLKLFVTKLQIIFLHKPYIISVPASIINDYFLKEFKHFNFFTFTLNSTEDAKMFNKYNNLRVVLTDNPKLYNH